MKRLSTPRYRCENELCHLGTRVTHGHFTGGISEEQAVMLTGDPEAEHGEGVCPNCGVAGEPDGDHDG